MGAELFGAGDRFDSTNEDPATRLGSYNVVNLFAGYAFAHDWRIDLRWNNVFNQDYELVQGYNTPGSNVFVTLKYQMR
jgi:vitamin B12 transporter